MSRDNVTTEDWIVAGLALLLAISLLFFPWFNLTVTIGTYSLSANYPATGTPDGWLGIAALIATVLVLADIAVERLSPDTEVPAVRGSRTETRFILAAVAAGFIVLKFLFHIDFAGSLSFAWGFYVTIIVAAALVYYTMQQRDAGSSYVDGTSRPGSGTGSRSPERSTGSKTSGTGGATSGESDAPRAGS